MAKRKQNTPPIAVNTSATHKVGQELIYSDHQTLMEKVTIQAIESNGYLLSNGIRVNFDLNRTDSRVFLGSCILADENGLIKFEAYSAQQRILRHLPDISKKVLELDKMNLSVEAAQALSRIDKHITKIKSLLNYD